MSACRAIRPTTSSPSRSVKRIGRAGPVTNANPLRRLDCVFAAIDHGSLRQAARALGVRESSVSRNIVAIEQSLDMQLFDRSAHGVRLTKAGKRWAGSARAHYEALYDALSAGKQPYRETDTLRLGLSGLAGRDFLGRLIRRFGALYPKIDVVIKDIAHDQGLAAIRRRELDILFTGAHVAMSRSTESFGQGQLFVLLPAHHRLAAASAVRWSDLANERVFVPSFWSGSASEIPLAGHSDATQAQICTASEATAILNVQLGQGVTLAEAGFARAVSPEFTIWRPLKGNNSAGLINAVWLGSNPKRALLRLLGTAKRLADPRPRGRPTAWR
ncbi:LysR family transcriptional regulator [Mesorhizobium sp. NPDC059054]|uniref:LysR family transcriptional regulator n=1 Tax=Mesorhizobium sp. NPDC059054 TaxID=3346711 RepID=UPI00369F2E82